MFFNDATTCYSPFISHSLWLLLVSADNMNNHGLPQRRCTIAMTNLYYLEADKSIAELHASGDNQSELPSSQRSFQCNCSIGDTAELE